MANMMRNYTLRIHSDVLEKFHVISRANGRSTNMQLLIYIQKTIERYESENGVIETQGSRFTASKTMSDPGPARKKQ